MMRLQERYFSGANAQILSMQVQSRVPKKIHCSFFRSPNWVISEYSWSKVLLAASPSISTVDWRKWSNSQHASSKQSSKKNPLVFFPRSHPIRSTQVQSRAPETIHIPQLQARLGPLPYTQAPSKQSSKSKSTVALSSIFPVPQERDHVDWSGKRSHAVVRKNRSRRLVGQKIAHGIVVRKMGMCIRDHSDENDLNGN